MANRFTPLAAALGITGTMFGAVLLATSPEAVATPAPFRCVEVTHVCAPGNPEGITPGCFDEGGVLVAPWPCHLTVNPDGTADVWDDTPGADDPLSATTLAPGVRSTDWEGSDAGHRGRWCEEHPTHERCARHLLEREGRRVL